MRASSGYPPGPDYDLAAARSSLASLAAPTLVVVGERDALTGVSVAQRFADAMPSVEVAVVGGAGHFPWVDEPTQFATAVETFLATRPAG